MANSGAALSESPDAGLECGASIGRYVVIRELGRGGMGVVYEAFDPELERKLAVKLVRSGGPSQSPGTCARMLREAQSMAKVSHPNAITVHDVGTWEEQVFIAMELVDGRTLRAWIRSERELGETMSVLHQAGRGLAAIHASGLVHRDFKPDNVMLGADGRVRVMDFGLVLGASAGPPASASASARVAETMVGSPVVDFVGDTKGEGGERDDTGGTDQDRDHENWATAAGEADTRLTRAGTLVGTPAYMSPEQLARDEADARSDQFAFAVVCHEALSGARPFRGEDLEALSAAVCAGEADTRALASAGVPRRAQQALGRALSVAPEDRFPSMDALLEELDYDRWMPRRRVLIAGAGVLGLALAALVGLRAGANADSNEVSRCDDREALLGSAWTPERAEAIRGAFAATQLAYAPALAGRAVDQLEDYADDLSAARAEACRGDDGLAEALQVQQAVCLQRGAAALEGLSEGLATVDAQGVDRSVKAISTLPSLARCADPEWLADERRPPDDPDRATAVVALELELESLHAKVELGRFAEAGNTAEVLLDRARRLGYGPTLAVALFHVGALRERQGAFAEAEGLLSEGVLEATAAGREALAVEVGSRLAYLIGSQLHRPAEAAIVITLATGQLRSHQRRRGSDPALEADLLADRGSVELAAGDAAAATETWERVLSLREEALPAGHPLIGDIHYNVGVGYFNQGRHGDAAPHWRESLLLRRQAYGGSHPFVADSLDAVAIVEKHAGDLDAALEYYDQALIMRRALLGPEHPDLARSLTNIGIAQTSAGRYDDARASLEEARSLLAASDPENVDIAYPLDAMADVSRAEGDLPRAVRERREAWALVVGGLGEEHPRALSLAEGIAADEASLAATDE